MCLIALAYKAHPHYPLVLAANRDEFRERPAVAAHWWSDDPQLLAGGPRQLRRYNIGREYAEQKRNTGAFIERKRHDHRMVRNPNCQRINFPT